jgi:subtilisin family serine protease
MNHLGSGEVIGVLDSGVYAQHPKLAGKITEHVEYSGSGMDVTSQPPKDEGCHGTKVSALLVGGNQHESVAPEARVAVARVLEGPVRQEKGTIAQIAAGFNWLASARQRHPISVANVSIEFVAQDPGLPALQALMSQLEVFGVKPIIPVGNRGPANRTLLNGVGLTVGAIDQSGNVCSFSGDRPDIVAPGHGIPCCQPPLAALGGQTTSIYHGTSLAVAFVAGALAVLRSATKRSIDDCVNAILQAAARNSGLNAPDVRQGWGSLDAKTAYDILVSTPGAIPAP